MISNYFRLDVDFVTFELCVWFARDSSMESGSQKKHQLGEKESKKLYLALITIDKNNYRLAVGGGDVITRGTRVPRYAWLLAENARASHAKT